MRLLYRQSQHHLRGQVDKVQLQHLRYERERTGGTQVALNHEDIIVARHILDVEGTVDMQRLGNLTGDALDAANGLYIKFLRRELDGGVARMHTGKLDMLGDGISQDFTVTGHSVHLDLLGMFDELRHHHRMILRNVGGQLQETAQLLTVRADVHRRTREHIRRTHQHGEAYPIHKLVDILHRGQCTPLGLIHTQLIQHLREFRTVLSAIDIRSLRTQDVHMLLVKIDGEVIGNLTSRGDNHTMGLFKLDDIEHPLKGELVEVETVTHIVVGRDGLGIIVDHHRAPTLLTDGVQRLHTAPVELHR